MYIVERFDSYLSKELRKKEEEAARVLKYANVLIVSLRELDLSFRRETSGLRYLTANASDSDRQEIEHHVRRFAEDHVILPRIEDAVGVLDYVTETSHEEYVPIVKELVEKGNRVIMSARGAGDFTTLFDEPELDRLLQEMHWAKDEDAAQRVREKARAKLDVYDHAVIRIAGDYFTDLKNKIHEEYPNVPEPIE
jgi:hypothetical protein